MSDGTEDDPTTLPQSGVNAPTQAPAIHDAPVAPAPAETLPAVPTDAAEPLTPKERDIAESQARVDASAARLADIKAKVAEGLAKEEAEHQQLVDAHAELTKPEPRDPAKVIGVDFGANGSYTYVDVPKGAEPRQRQYLHDGSNIEHVAEDADGVWLYRRM